jgi:uncharacterized protein
VKVSIVVILSLLLAASASAQSNPQQPRVTKPPAKHETTPPGSDASSSSRAKIDPVKETDIRRLLDLMGAKAAMVQIMGGMEENLRPIITNSLPPGDYREQLVNFFIEKFQSRATDKMQELVEGSIPLYDKYFSDEDIKGLIRFYETPIGQKAITQLPKISMEMQAQGMKLGQDIGRESMLEVLAEHPELGKALEEAQKTAHPQ